MLTSTNSPVTLMISDAQLVRDLSKHFRDRLYTLIEDTTDTCKRCNLGPKDAGAVIIKNTLDIAFSAALALGATEPEILRTCAECLGRMAAKRRQQHGRTQRNSN